MHSYPTPAGVTKEEYIHPYFLKLHPGAPVHVFTKAEDIHFHTHPFAFRTHIVLGGYVEQVLQPNSDGTWHVEEFKRLPGTTHDMPLNAIHKLVGLIGEFCITRCEYGPTLQKPGVVKLDKQGMAWHRYEHETDQDWKQIMPVLETV